jgi:hypothetical protein
MYLYGAPQNSAPGPENRRASTGYLLSPQSKMSCAERFEWEIKSCPSNFDFRIVVVALICSLTAGNPRDARAVGYAPAVANTLRP